jgi:hypothetical protein
VSEEKKRTWKKFPKNLACQLILLSSHDVFQLHNYTLSSDEITVNYVLGRIWMGTIMGYF